MFTNINRGKIFTRLWFVPRLIIVAVLVVAAVMLAAASCSRSQDADADVGRRHYVAVILKSTDSEFFRTVISGAEAAATEYNLYLTIEGPDSEEDFETQNYLVRQAMAGGAEAIVFSSADYEGTAEAVNEAGGAGIKIIAIDSEVDSGYVMSKIGTDNTEAGRLAAEALLGAGDRGEYQVGIVNFDANTANGQQREQGLREVLENNPMVSSVTTINVASDSEAARRGTLDMLAQHPGINAVAALNEWTTLGAGQAVRDLGLDEEVAVCGFDSNVGAVELLETGGIDALIVQNPYAMGYLGVETAYKAIAGQDTVSEQHTDVIAVTRDNLYDEECQRLVFNFY